MNKALLIFPLVFASLVGVIEPAATGAALAAPVTQTQTFSGTITAGRQVTVRNNSDQVAGAIAGGLIGGLLGNQFGNGKGRDAATVAGALGGAAAGSRMAKGSNDRQSMEWTVRLKDGRTVGVIQDGKFKVGQHVKVVMKGKSIQIVP
jgi:outer membrane lipoprotein SlyB